MNRSTKCTRAPEPECVGERLERSSIALTGVLGDLGMRATCDDVVEVRVSVTERGHGAKCEFDSLAL
jgi:hypothetical protein